MPNKVGCLVAVVWLTGCAVQDDPAPVADSVANRGRIHSNIPQALTYQVKAGDTLFSIAFRSGMDFKTLARLNRISEPYTIYVGQVLVVTNPDAPQTAVVGPGAEGRSANKNHSNSNSSTSRLKTSKVVASQKQTRYGQDERVEESEKIPNSTISGNVKQWLWPVKGPILEKFSAQEHGNKGLDIGGTVGTPIKATAAGQVVYAGNALRGYGNLVIIRHNDDFLSAYAHNSRLLVKERDSVVAGQVIAEMGNSDADKVKLHFEIRFRGKSVDPLRYLK